MINELNYDDAVAKLIKIAEDLEKKEKGEPLSSEIFEVISVLSKVHKDDPVDDEWDDVYNMFEDMMEYAKNNGRELVSADRPMQLRLGWVCKNTGKTWSIHISTFKSTLDRKFSTKEVDVIKTCIMTQAGKQSLIDFINTYKYKE